MANVPTTDSEIKELFGAPAREIQPDEDQLAVQLTLRTMRDELMEAAELDGVGVNQLARRLNISPSSVSRFLGGEGDFHVSTAALYARALGRRWECSLVSDDACRRDGNHHGRPTAIVGIDNHVTATVGNSLQLEAQAPRLSVTAAIIHVQTIP